MAESQNNPEPVPLKSYLAVAGLFTLATILAYAGGETHQAGFLIAGVFLFAGGAAILA